MVQDKGFIAGVLAVTLLLIGGAIWFLGRPAEVPQAKVLSAEEIVRDVGYNVMGNLNAPVTIVEFSDPQCPACRAMELTMKALLAQYPETVRLVYRHFPLPIHDRAIPASRALEAAGKQNKFYPMLEGLFANQDNLSDEKFNEIGTTIGLDLQKFNQDRNSDEIKQIVDSDKQKALDLDLPGTPTLFVNGKQIIFSGNESSLERLKSEVDAILAQSPNLEIGNEETSPSAVAQ